MKQNTFIAVMVVEGTLALISMGLLFSDVGAVIYLIALALFAVVLAPLHVRGVFREDKMKRFHPYAKVKGRNPNGNANRAHMAAELLEQGYVTSIREAFDTILSDDGGFYVPPPRLQLIDVIKELRRIGTLPVLAHPLQELTESELRALLPDAIDAGLVGMETMHSSYSMETISLAEKIAAEFNLLSSGGSDFHGSVKPDISLGTGKGALCVPVNKYEALEKLLMKQSAD